MSVDRQFLERALIVAREAADAAATEIQRFYRQAAAVERKSDDSPVTAADRGAEQAIRRIIERAFPGHAIYGEEEGGKDENAEFLWLVDPLDGTRSFVRDYPMFSTQIGLRAQGELVLGVSHAPWCAETGYAIRGGGAFVNGVLAHVGNSATLERAQLSFGNLRSLAGEPVRWSRLAALLRTAERTRGYGDFYHYHLLARGAVDAVIESDVDILDIAALSVIVREAGGVFTDLDGRNVDLETRSVLAATPELYPIVAAAMRGCVDI